MKAIDVVHNYRSYNRDCGWIDITLPYPAVSICLTQSADIIFISISHEKAIKANELAYLPSLFIKVHI